MQISGKKDYKLNKNNPSCKINIPVSPKAKILCIERGHKKTGPCVGSRSGKKMKVA
jgi:hypothetical protein